MLALCLIVWLLSVSYANAGWIDSDTPDSVKETISIVDGKTYELVFSDEFNLEGRRFDDGFDPRWTAVDKNDYTNNALHYYKADKISTSKGSLRILTVNEDITFKAYQPYGKGPATETKHYQSGMLQGWNKFCFTGGIIEIRAKLPGKHDTGGLWPALWLLGNLARATYLGSSENMWPWSYSKCNRSIQKSQEVSGCNNVNHFDFDTHRGRGAPEIDILEVMPGKGKVGQTNFTLPYLSTSLQISPGISHLRPHEGLFPDKTKHEVWYEDGLSYGINTSLNIFFYGVKLQSVPKSKSYQADAVSANTGIGSTHFKDYHTYRVEWQPGEDGYIRWSLDDVLLYDIQSSALNLTGAVVPEEPMFILLNTAISSSWGFPAPCPWGCKCNCYDCRNDECFCAIPENMCDNFPAEFLIDYVRVYQDAKNDNHTLGCSPKSHPTKTFIKAHWDRYKDITDELVLLEVNTGGGTCTTQSDCGGNIREYSIGHSSAAANDMDEMRGKCVKNVCVCSSRYAGPHCMAPSGFYDSPEEEDDTCKVVLKMHTPLFVTLLLIAFTFAYFVVCVSKYKESTRGQYRAQPFMD